MDWRKRWNFGYIPSGLTLADEGERGLLGMSHSIVPEEPSAFFEISSWGYIRHWLVAGPGETPYSGPPGPDHVLRRESLDEAIQAPPARGVLGEPGPFGGAWNFYDPGRNEFVEFSTFYQRLTVVEYFAFTEIEVPGGGKYRARFWAAGLADLWVNDGYLARLKVTRYRNPDCKILDLPLVAGVNRLCVRLQCLGVRDTRILFGLCLEEPGGIAVRMPGALRLAEASNWIDGVRGRPEALESAVPAPFEARVLCRGTKPLAWPSGGKVLSLKESRPVSLTVEMEIGGTSLQRQIEIPANRPPGHPFQGDRRRAQLEYVAKAGTGTETPASWNGVILPLIARRLLGRATDGDAAAFAQSLALVDERRDCADFILAGLLRMIFLRLATEEEAAEIRRAALAFRYWPDEPGNDAMCFHSENHSLLFHGCQLLAGKLYPEENFSNSGRSGREQQALALARIRQWLDRIEARGFEEFNSGTYMPITISAMLNVADFSGDGELSRRMSAQIDRIYRDLAFHSFGGGVISPQGRIYRDVIVPEESGTQVLLALATEATDIPLEGPRPPRERTGDWVVFPASSPAYSAPGDLAAKVREPVSRIYRHADVEIVLEKTPSYILTSLSVPAVPREGEHPDNDLRPGGAGYQQHLWQATLGRDCHIFVNHPGGFFDGTKSRPGYWHGSGLLPRVRQRGSLLQAIHVIADGTKTKPEITADVWEWGSASSVRPYDLHPIAFVHAHWPSDSFEREERRGSWIFGQKGSGLIGLWCSEPLVPHDDILTGRELRAKSYASAWLVVCGDAGKAGSLEAFMESCQSLNPFFDRSDCTMSVRGEEKMRWWERPEPMPS